MGTIDDHPLRYGLANELHARPFPPLDPPARAAFLAIKRPEDAAKRDKSADLAHLCELLDRFGAHHPKPGATHWYGQIGNHDLKWESHTEFVTYTVFGRGVADTPFDSRTFEVFPQDWLDRAPGQRVTSALIRVELQDGADGIAEKLDAWFVPESLAASAVVDEGALIAGDFRIDSAGHIRFAVFARPGLGVRRLGRIAQRLCEIEVYKSMSMLGLARVRSIGARMGEVDGELIELMGDMTSEARRPEGTLQSLLKISTELESMLAKSAFRFGATRAYAAIVHDRIDVLREERFDGRQTFKEFMVRRFDPAMRTVEATEYRLGTMAERSMRAANLLRTQVDVERSAQNQALLE
ncbi:MAG: DUF3422 domain-containing protein, partial [Pseudomonadota bacterium]